MGIEHDRAYRLVFGAPHDAVTEFRTLEAEAAELREKVAGLETALRAHVAALTGLTVGGSEFFGKKLGDIYLADIPYCQEHVRERYASGHAAKIELVDANRGRRAAEAALKEAVRVIEPFAKQHGRKSIRLNRDHFRVADRWLSQHSGASNAE